LARHIEDGFGEIQQLILIGKGRGYLLYDDINDSLPADVHSSQEIDDLLSILEREGIEIYEDLAIANATRAAANAAEGPEADLKEELADEGTQTAPPIALQPCPHVSGRFVMRHFRLSKFCTHEVRYPAKEIA